jgi:hypothetical protein
MGHTSISIFHEKTQGVIYGVGECITHLVPFACQCQVAILINQFPIPKPRKRTQASAKKRDANVVYKCGISVRKQLKLIKTPQRRCHHEAYSCENITLSSKHDQK